MTGDTLEPLAVPSEREPVTNGDLYRRTSALADKIEKLASKSTLVELLAMRTVHRTWLTFGTLSEVDAAAEQLLVDLKGWAKIGRSRNTGKRLDRLLEHSKAVSAAIAEGRPLPRSPRRKRRRKVRP